MKIERYQQLEVQFIRKRILVIGDVMLDNYLWGNAERISPEAPVPIVQIKSSSSTPGGAANVANNLASLGAKVSVCSIVGDDNNGITLKKILTNLNIDIKGVFVEPNRTTTVKTRIIAQNQQVVRTDWEDKSSVDDNINSLILNFIENRISEFDAVILEDYNKGLLNTSVIKRAIKIFKENSVKVYVDPKIDNFFDYQDIDFVKPNIYEAGHSIKIDLSDENSFIKGGQLLREQLRCKILLLTRGELGMTIFDSSGYQHIPTRARKVHDVSGAGDTVIATFCLAHISGASAVEAATLANYAAGRVCEEVGVAPITKEKLHEIIVHHNS